jgi:flagellar protein FliS
MPIDPRPETIESARPDELVLMLFEGAVRFGGQAVDAFDEGRDADAAALVGRVTAILEELDRSLDRGVGTVGRQLGAIYDYLLRKLRATHVDRVAVAEVVADVADLAETWAVLVSRNEAELAAA